MLEPSNPQEVKDFMRLACELSRKFDTAVFLRTTIRLSHSKAPVTVGKPKLKNKPEILFNSSKYVMVPSNARMRRLEVEKRTIALKEFVETFAINTMEINRMDVDIITAGVPYEYAKASFPDYSYLKLGMVNLLPEKLIREFTKKVKKIFVIEELDPFLDDQIKAMEIKVIDKEIFPFTNEFDSGVVAKVIDSKMLAKAPTLPVVPPRPPNLCMGCPHRVLFYVLGKSKALFGGDIGCYTL